jgi:hypothetical protein
MSAPKPAMLKPRGRAAIPAHFNPATLELTVSTRLGPSQDKTQGSRQVVNEGTAKLSVELVFDTTGSLKNVCDTTRQVAQLLGYQGRPPPLVTFEWGAFRFKGIVDSFKETLDFFSADGVPLRSTVALTMLQEKYIFSRGKRGEKAAGWSGESGGDEGEDSPPAKEAPPPPPGFSLTLTATLGGAPEAGRALAALNGEESMRFPRSPVLVVDVSAPRAPPMGFSSVAAPAVATGAFAGLRTPLPGTTAVSRLDASRLQHRVETHTHAADGGANFKLGGQMTSQGSQLGGTARSRLRFEED